MNGVTYEKDDCPCLSCVYLLQATRLNEKPNGEYSLNINCGITGCPKGFQSLRKQNNDQGIRSRISDCIKMLNRCIDLKSKDKGGEPFEK